MLENIVEILKHRHQAVREQIRTLQAEVGKLDDALRALETLAAPTMVAVPAPQPIKARKRTMSAAGRQAVAAAAKARWAKLRAQKEAEAQEQEPVKRDPRPANIMAEPVEQKSETLVPASERIPCTCGGINPTCMHCGGSGMREP